MPSGGFIDLIITGADGVQALQRRVATYELRLTDHSEPLAQIGQDALQSFRNQFASQGHEFGGGWAPLAPSTLQHKRGPNMLIETGQMYASMQVISQTSNSLSVGFTDPKARYHQSGTSKMPARLLVGLSPEMSKLVVRRFNEWVQRILSQG